MMRLNGVTRSNSRSRAVIRQAWLARAGIANSVTSPSSPAGMAPCWSLATRSARCITASRSTGSSSWVGRAASISETRLPYVPAWSLRRTDTGTAATSGAAGSWSWPAR
jgi:hypothetical protein